MIFEDLRFRLRCWLAALIINALNIGVCENCGVLAARSGSPVRVSDDTRSPFVSDVDGENIGYYCERCFNCGLIAADLKRVKEEFGTLV